MLFFRILTAALVVFCLVLVFTEGILTALAMFGLGSLTLWAVITLVDLFVRIGSAFQRPNQHVHLYFDKHPDPTRPDPTEDVHPIIVINEAKWKERN